MFRHITARSLAEGIEKSMRALAEYSHIEERENQDRMNEMKEIQLLLDITQPESEPFISKAMPCDLKTLIQYEREFLDGTADDLGWKYTYHGLYSPFYPKVLEELRRNIHSRRAVIALGQGDINFTSDPPCLQTLLFSVVNGALELTCLFRSNDGVKAFPMNIQAIAALQRKAADDLSLPVGELHYIANNFHAYQNDFDQLDSYIKLFDRYGDDHRRKCYSFEQYKKKKEEMDNE